MKEKTCRAEGCDNTFIQRNSLHVACSPPCALAVGKSKAKAKRDKQARRERTEYYANDRAFQIKKAQAAFNAFIRERDKYKPCISCGAPAGTYKITAGHYKTTGAAPALRFNENNCFGQCWWNCNSNKSGNIVEYRKGLIERIGLEAVEELEKYHPPANLTLEQVVAIKMKYKAKLKALKQIEPTPQ